ncbi:uncharacterized protein LOC123678479 isoform X1 [Harmonia axyridis]|uniref:uncharacterized protein LOC123678479 isoform X1 n=1 Tax=Harmonia axyridis TaxID=115357 RepID=UPI001E277265|nr:uncharacterized protein LOC123678479 isoform X1 [Harmonia axyridis]
MNHCKNQFFFQLRKWLTNSSDLIEHFNIDINVKSSILNLSVNQNSKTMGVFWNASSDTIEYNISQELGYLKENKNITKRSILSAISQLFDPMGLVSPIVMKAKFILQLVWKEKEDWDEPVYDNLRKNWIKFLVNLQELKNIKIPRPALLRNAQSLEIHLFVDASEKGYGACVYIKKQISSGIRCNLICFKSKVAPIKQLSLPRLELCAALIGSKLLAKVKGAIKLDFQKTFCWTDSLVTYHWIQGSPNKWKTFIANRVSKIQTLTHINDWHHVRSKENPADLISRGAIVSDLTRTNFWFHGPHWLKRNSDEYPLKKITIP